MNLLLISDTHIRGDIPVGRTVDFLDQQFEKWVFILEYFSKMPAPKYIVQAGDLWHRPNPSFTLMNKYLALFRDYGVKILGVLGQHDLLMRDSDVRRTVIGTMEMLDLYHRLSPDTPFLLKNFQTNKDYDVALWGVSYGEAEIPVPVDGIMNILVIHDMIGNRPLYPGHKLTLAHRFLCKHEGFDLILCGDYHYPFLVENKGRSIINTGCLLRMTRDERDMKRSPCFYVFDTESRNLMEVEIPSVPYDVAFDLTEKAKSYPDLRDIEAFVERIKLKDSFGIDYLDVLDSYCSEKDVPDEVRELIFSRLQEGE